MSLDGVGRIVGVPSSLTFVDGSTWTPLPGERDLRCDRCGATWVGYDGDPCGWCADSLERLRAEQRQTLLHPSWLTSDNGPRYDELSEVDKRIWDRTRRVERGAESIRGWVERLANAVRAGLITDAEARAATCRVKQSRERR